MPASTVPVIDIRVTGKDLAERCALLRQFVPEIAREAVQEIGRQQPELVRRHDPRYEEVLRQSTEWTIDHFISLMIDPSTSSAEILDFYRQLGMGEAREGRTLAALQASLRIGSGVAIQQLTRESERLEMDTTPATMAQIAQALFGYHDRLTEAAAQGHAEAAAQASSELENRRRALVDLIIDPESPPGAIEDLAQLVQWKPPRTVAAVALDLRRKTGRPTLPSDVLPGLHLTEPCLIVPDPEGPGRRKMLEGLLKGRPAAVGPAVDLPEAAKSLRWARQALAHTRSRVLPAGQPVFVTDHLAIMMLMQDQDLADRAMQRRLAPLMAVRPALRERLAETLIACFECRFNSTEVSSRLHVHPQTVRYRIRRLEALFGEQISDPAQHLELHMLLRIWLATSGTT